jgi:hypothetical protein
MRQALLALAMVAGVQAPRDVTNAARLFDSGVTFAHFLDGTKTQHDLWERNAARADSSPSLVDRLKRVSDGLRVLVVSEDWCADSVHTVPYIAGLAAAAGVDLRVVDRNVGEPIMLAHRTRDGRPVTPTVVLLRHNVDVGAWIERPAPLQRLFFAMATDPESARKFAQRDAWYDADRGRTTIAEFVALAEKTVRR